MQKAYQKDATAKGFSKNHEDPHAEVQDGVILYQGKVYIPFRLQREVIKRMHDDPLHRHPGREKMLELLQREYYFPHMRQKVDTYLRQCEDCARNKLARHKPYRQLQPLQAPERAWQSVSMDFIVKLPTTKDPITKVSYDSILVIVDRLTKYAHFIPWRETNNTEDLANIFLREVVAHHGIPETIISDRDKLFTSKF